jgi:ABC-type multidrug transport system fused ATPase/permease subunit
VTPSPPTVQRFYATLVCLIDALPWGLETPIFERGANLSVSEKQLLSLTRALAYNAAILILDEATPCVDGEAEALIQEGMKQLLVHHTALVIGHRLSTIREMDRLLVRDHGRLVEAGTPEQLLASGGLYRKLSSLQFAADSMFAPAAPKRSASPSNTPAMQSSRVPSLAPRH